MALTFGCVNAALAQGQLTLYGSMDESVPWISNIQGHGSVRMDAGISQPDLFGIRGTEDLGGGMKALFQLENGFLTDSGSMIAAGKLFNRASWIGLEGKLGIVKLGRQVDFTADKLGQWSNGYQLFNFYLYHPGNLDGLSSQFPVDNAITYRTPVFGGMQASAMYGLGEVPGDRSANRTYSFAGTYAGARLNLAIAYTDANGRAFDINGTTGIAQAMGQGLAAGRALPIDSFKAGGIGGGYRLETLPISVNALYSRSTLRVGMSQGTMNAADLGLSWQATPATAVNIGYSFSKFERTKWHQLNLGSMYYLSKRTQLYALWTYQHAVDGVAAMNVVGISSGRNQSVVSAGIHTSF
ncbi:Outer membrane protein (porin) [Cupriavidus basilensis]|uniref:Outer membrane protein (Porin) n=1 Tax=Cupriavidus basilensis TaxID=68895 RepID=A0A0C4YPW5_9BURK|nr:Outer membrane protein (porin) [Cupriavidus basilensis]